MCRAAFDLGITHFDLANNYGPPPGSAEENFGGILKTDFAGHRDELVISTKAGYLMWPGPYGEWGSRKYLLASLDQSLKRMGLDYVDIFYSHRVDPEHAARRDDGRARHGGAPGQGALCRHLLLQRRADRRRPPRSCASLGTPCLIHQPSYSMLNRWIEEDGLLDTLEKEGIGCIAFSPLAQGMLTDKYLKGVPADSRASGRQVAAARSFLSEETVARIRALNEIAKQRGQSLAQMAIAWVLRDPRVTSALIGASRVGADPGAGRRAGRTSSFSRRSLRRSTATPRRAASICGSSPARPERRRSISARRPTRAEARHDRRR